jgi:ParB/RepB/Spo0J family partition protein
MAKKDFAASINKQFEQKTSSQAHDTIAQLEKENYQLIARVREYEKKKDLTDSVKVSLDEIITVSNIRDNLDFEEIERLAANIKELGQLQPVLLTKDNHLVSGYRRYTAVKSLGEEGPGFLYALKLDKNYDEIDSLLFLKIQYAENENRRSLDNFHLSKLFNELKVSGKNQMEISEIFGKSKGTVSSIIAIKNIHPELAKLIKEFQIYAWSKKKFLAKNQEELNQDKFYHTGKGIIGWQPLYAIAKNDNVMDQKKAFLKLYKNRLTEEELQSDFFKTANKAVSKDKTVKPAEMLKSLKSMSESILGIKGLPKEELAEAKSYLEKLQKILQKVSG